MMILISGVALALTLQAQPEVQTDGQSATPEVAVEQAVSEADRRNERVCERREVTGSGISRRVCTTRGAMVLRAEADRQRLESMQGVITVDQSNGFAPPQ
ncbi:MAG: hypothetical protein ACK4Y4_10575 [Brevundimonas sp.]